MSEAGAATHAAGAAAPQANPSARRLRVLFVTQYFPPETGAAPARAAHFVRALGRSGHDVRVVTGLPNHPSGVIQSGYRSGYSPTGRFGDALVERVWLYATPKKTALTRLWNHASFALSALPRVLGGPRPDVVIATMPPLFLGLSAWIAAARWRVPFVVDCRDDWPYAAVALGEMRPGPATTILSWLSRFLYVRAARVLAVTPGMRRQLAARGLDSGRIELVTNGADTELFRPTANGAPIGHVANAPAPARRCTVLYAGTHGLVHGMEVLLDAAERLKGRDDLEFVFVGDGVAKPALEARAAESGLTRVAFHPSVPPERLVEWIHRADVCVATTRDHPFCGETIPVKLFDYLACGRPVVAAVRGDAADVVRASGGGVVVEPGDGASLAEALSALADDPARRASLGAAGPPFVARQYSRQALGGRLVTIVEETYERAVGRPVTPEPHGVYRVVKRAIDLVASLAMLIVFLPIMLVVAIAIRVDSKGPIVFRQRRIGRGSAEFTIFKFRTMTVGTPDLASHLMGPGSPHVTGIGRFLRRSSLDELPQLWNIVRGEMSLVGPRPALFNQYDLIAMRQEVDVDALKPGVTGWAQIHGRDEIPLRDKVAYDRYYRERCSPWLDVVILFRTAFTVFSSRGVY
jgi:lipopolysaccharide/colanic/teichoic acid biosynthesis glycosyltransferase/glycosyltransferase involved in cell wall biosynthesis